MYIVFIVLCYETTVTVLGAASRCVKILGQVGRLCPKSTSLGRKQERYVGYAGIKFGSIPASRCVSTAFQRGMTRRDATQRPSVINYCEPVFTRTYLHVHVPTHLDLSALYILMPSGAPHSSMRSLRLSLIRSTPEEDKQQQQERHY